MVGTTPGKHHNMSSAPTRAFPKTLILPWVATALASCGSNENAASTGPLQGRVDPKSVSNTNATAKEVAHESRGDLDCPPRIRTAARPASHPVDDIVSVRPGLTYEEASNLILCTNDLMTVREDGRGFNIQTYGQKIRSGFSARPAEPRVEKTSKQIMQEMQDETFARGSNRASEDMKAGETKWGVGTMGLPGEERVISVVREEWFPEGRNPTMESVEQALLKKYGLPTRNQKNGGITFLTWTHDPMGRPVTETSPLANQCVGVSDPDGGSNFSPDCGTVVAARIGPMQDNPALSKYLQLGVIDQAGGYELITATEQAFQKQETQRRAKQVDEAARNADGPQL
jgi:hypothetical protein